MNQSEYLRGGSEIDDLGEIKSEFMERVKAFALVQQEYKTAMNIAKPVSPTSKLESIKKGETINSNENLVKEIKALRQEINNRPIEVKANIAMDGQKVADLTLKNLTSPRNVSNRVNEGAITNGAVGEVTQY